MKTEFEELASINFLSTNKNNNNYSTYRTRLAKIFWDAQQSKIDKLEHDLGNERCANRMLQHVLDKEVKS